MGKDLSQQEMIRYARHLVMPEVGLEGQRKLKHASVLIIGTGGLGSPISLYLTAAGIGHIGLVDYDEVDISNLQRQVVHDEYALGSQKVISAKKRLEGLNSNVKIDIFHEIFSSKNAERIARDYDILVDGTDNFPTRYLLNDLAVLTGKPYIYGSVFRFEGQISVFDAKKGPCYRCLFPQPPEPGMVPSCAEGGVMGVMPGIIGTLQAAEVIKLILGIGEPLIGRLMLVDALNMEFQTIQIQKNPACVICGKNSTLKKLIDYEDFCGAPFVNTDAEPLPARNEISPQELKKKIDANESMRIIDVRSPVEYSISKFYQAEFVPLEELENIARQWDQKTPIVVVCRLGLRSARAVERLLKLGFTNVRNLEGGLNAWSKQIKSKNLQG